ncbi:MAG: hypothetical protein IMX01_02285 [Limnochordaceae bacterium]|nr:hypothetical protein [Limnochordaceae bacterium]
MALPTPRTGLKQGVPGPQPVVSAGPAPARRRQRWLVWGLVGVALCGFALGLYLTRDQLHPGQWFANLPLIGGPIRTYQLGLQESARLAEAEKGIQQERQQVQQAKVQLQADRQQLTLAQQALQRQQAELQQQAADLARARQQLGAAAQAANASEQALRIYRQLRPSELAAILDTQPADVAVAILGQLPADQAAAAVAKLHPLKAARLLQLLASRPAATGTAASPSGTPGTATRASGGPDAVPTSGGSVFAP